MRPVPEGAQGGLVEAQGGLELGAGDRVLNMVDHVRQLQALGAGWIALPCGGLGSAQKAHETAAQVGRFAEVRLGRGIGRAQRENSRSLREAAQAGAGIGRIEADGVG